MKIVYAMLGALLMAGSLHAQTAPASAPLSAPVIAPVTAPASGDTQAQRQISQPGNNAPVWRAVNAGKPNYASIPAPEASVLIQPRAQFPGQARATTAGEAWRQYRNGPVTLYGGIAVLLMTALIAVFYAIRGEIRLSHPLTGRMIERFTSFERLVHWSMAISFMILAATGLMMLFGKYVVMPLFGQTIFGFFTYLGKNLHNFVGPVFSVSVIVAFLVFVRDNLPQSSDLGWLLKGGGLMGGGHASSHRFNAGEKLWFWGGVVVLGIVISASGFVLDMLVPGFDYSRSWMQVANIVHGVGALLFVSMALGHIYIGSIGMQGAYAAMRTGWVDESWAMEHHDLWYADIKAGKIPAVRTPPQGGVAATPPSAVQTAS